MGIAIADVDDNGRPDVFTSNFSSDTNTLHLNTDGEFFNDSTRRYGLGIVSRPYLGWASAFFDFNHDTFEDLIVFNGHVYPGASRESMDSDYNQRALLFARAGDRFELLAAPDIGPAILTPHCDRGAAFSDLDADGDIDIIVAELNGPVRILRNDAPIDNWLIVQIPTTHVGARVDVTCGPQRWRRWIYSGGSFLSASPAIAHFALPLTCEKVEVIITWPDGTSTTLPDQSTRLRIRVSPKPLAAE
jgi:hypothetical protein